MEAVDKEIIYLAICNLLTLYSNLLETGELQGEDRELAEHIMQRAKSIEEKLREDLDPDKPHIIPRPEW